MLGISNSLAGACNFPSDIINIYDFSAHSTWTASDVDVFAAESGSVGFDVTDNDATWIVYSDAIVVPSHAEQVVVVYDFAMALLQEGGPMVVRLASDTNGTADTTQLAQYTNESSATSAYHITSANTAHTRLVFRDNMLRSKQTSIAISNCFVYILS